MQKLSQKDQTLIQSRKTIKPTHKTVLKLNTMENNCGVEIKEDSSERTESGEQNPKTKL
jgi:hypothetical protein